MALFLSDFHTAQILSDTVTVLLNEVTKKSAPSAWDKLIPLSPFIVSGMTILVTYMITIKNLNSKKEELERAEIYKKLNDFYGPMIQLRKKSRLLYKKFVEKHAYEGQSFKTLVELLNGRKFEGNDGELLSEIIKIGKDCEDLIQQKAGLIDDPTLRLDILPRASVHYLVIRLAFEKKLQGETENFTDLTFPHQIDELLENRRVALENRLIDLNTKESTFAFIGRWLTSKKKTDEKSKNN